MLQVFPVFLILECISELLDSDRVSLINKSFSTILFISNFIFEKRIALVENLFSLFFNLSKSNFCSNFGVNLKIICIQIIGQSV